MDSLASAQFERIGGENVAIVLFEPNEYSLVGLYPDEISAYRAKKVWKETLESGFLLDHESDMQMSVRYNQIKSAFELSCLFTSACGRYAFWRITNRMVPEAEYLIETAHIPLSVSRNQEIMSAPDMMPAPTSVIEVENGMLEGFRKALVKLLS